MSTFTEIMFSLMVDVFAVGENELDRDSGREGERERAMCVRRDQSPCRTEVIEEAVLPYYHEPPLLSPPTPTLSALPYFKRIRFDRCIVKFRFMSKFKEWKKENTSGV